MRLRSKLILTLMCMSLVSATLVGGIAYWMLMRDFNETSMRQAFANFQQDVRSYIGLYGSLQAGERIEPFPAFVQRTRRPGPAPGSTGGPPPDTLQHARNQAPFRFALLDGEGRILRPNGPYRAGDMVSADLRRQARPIDVDGRVVVWAAPLGTPNLSRQDMQYLDVMRQALATGVAGAALLAVLLGGLLGRSLSRSLDEVTAAVRALPASGELAAPLPVRSRDEIGDLARAFNSMSEDLDVAHRELRELAVRDPLTQLFNRRHFDAQAAQFYAQAVRYGHELSVMVGDLDHFKQINDDFSHAIGDEVLRRLAALLLGHLRTSDIVARYGGEEFVIVFPETPGEEAARLCETLRARIEAAPWHEVHPELRVSMSMGVCGDLTFGSTEKMLGAADIGLYEAKRGGRNRVCLHSPEPEAQRTQRT